MLSRKAIAASLTWALSISSVYSAPSVAVEGREIADHEVTFKTIYVPPTDYNTPKTLYGRTVQLEDGTLLATWENYSPEPPLVYFPIYKSTDKGETWAPFSTVTDQVNGWGLRYQPDLYLLPQAMGDLPKGAIICSANSIPTDLSQTKIDVYASVDDGKTWSFVSTVASGGVALPNNGETPVWEPFMMVYDNQLVMYYSDQRDSAYGQKMVHQVSSDGVTWGPVVNDIAYSTYEQRPGMPTVAALPNGQYIMTYEYGLGPNPVGSGTFPIYYRISSSPLTFDSAPGQILNAGGVVPTSSPYVVWSPSGGPNGSIIVSANSHAEVFINTNLGDPDSWVMYSTPQSRAYTRHLRVMDDPDYLLIMSAGFLNGDNYVTDSVMKLPNL